MEVIDPISGERRIVEGDDGVLQALQNLADIVEVGDAGAVPEATQAALDMGIAPFDVLRDGLQAGLAVVGERFKKNEAFIPEVLLTARAMHSGMEVLRPILTKLGNEPLGTVVLGTVQGDLHDIGKNMVGMMLEGAGFKVHDIGVNVNVQTFVDKIRDLKADLLCMSALLSTTMSMQGETIKAIKAAGTRSNTFRIMCGGAPVTEDYAKQSGADGFAPDAASAVDVAKKLIDKECQPRFISGVVG
jgi:5-methyltetrahydrofolate--homocysteine methyltransferase